ncbi:MAG: DUF456 domain-containing protein [Calditrichaeota bacterium]|nr:MAG: DUF456 domain-containing protein [Calditrichota bacterium]
MWATLLSVLAHILFWLSLLVGILMIPFGLPGTFVIAGSALIYGLLTHFAHFSLSQVLILFGIAILGEVIEFVLGAFTARRFGGSNYAMFGAIGGGFLGAIWATSLMPLIGTLLGAFAGAFAGAFLLEYLHHNKLDHAMRVGWGAFLGAVGGKMTKIALGIAMVVMITFNFF